MKLSKILRFHQITFAQEYIGLALASAGADWKHFLGAPLSGLCRKFLRRVIKS